MQCNQHKEFSLGDLLFVFRRNILESIREEGLKHDLTFSQIEVLRFVGPSGKETMKNIADYLKISPPSATEIVAELERKGLVKRKDDKEDRRVIFIVPTEMSRKLFVSMFKKKDIFFKKMISKLNAKDKKALERIIRILITK